MERLGTLEGEFEEVEGRAREYRATAGRADRGAIGVSDSRGAVPLSCLMDAST
jgi:hypothetical protein